MALITFLGASAVLSFGFGVRHCSSSGLASKKAGGAQGLGRGDCQVRWPEPTAEVFHAMGRHACSLCTWGLAGQGACCLGTGWASAGGRPAAALCTTCSFLPFPLPFHYNYYCHCCCYSSIFILFQLLNRSYLSLWVLRSFPALPIPLAEGGASERAAAWHWVTSRG